VVELPDRERGSEEGVEIEEEEQLEEVVRAAEQGSEEGI
jgi:hypothetical protein